jgi:hypothetical protein
MHNWSIGVRETWDNNSTHELKRVSALYFCSISNVQEQSRIVNIYNCPSLSVTPRQAQNFLTDIVHDHLSRHRCNPWHKTLSQIPLYVILLRISHAP